MPTGYTYYIQSGKITSGKEFLKLCTRAFGIAVDLKEESLDIPTPEKFKPDPYYKKSYDESVKSQNEIYNMTFEEAKNRMIDSYNNSRTSAIECVKKCKEEDEKYLKVKEEVEKWIPPTSEHENLKKFCLEQIDMSLNKSIYEFYEEELNKELDISDKGVENYISELKKSVDKDVERTYKKWQEEIKRTEEKNLWMKLFLDSLENI